MGEGIASLIFFKKNAKNVIFMLPVTLDVSKLNIILVAQGDLLHRRLRLLKEAGAERLKVFSPVHDPAISHALKEKFQERLPDVADMAGANLVLVAGIAPAQASEIAKICRSLGVLVNVEDVLPECDFHMPALVRRGDLLIAVSTGGKSPALARLLRQWLEKAFPERWADWLEEIAEKRLQWKKAGHHPKEIFARTEAELKAARLLPEDV
jgi:precorrin-2 dehydrogenase/sirohydrochlorin ferrochelatase